jgi:hypothetical protein
MHDGLKPLAKAEKNTTLAQTVKDETNNNRGSESNNGAATAAQKSMEVIIDGHNAKDAASVGQISESQSSQQKKASLLKQSLIRKAAEQKNEKQNKLAFPTR